MLIVNIDECCGIRVRDVFEDDLTPCMDVKTVEYALGLGEKGKPHYPMPAVVTHVEYWPTTRDCMSWNDIYICQGEHIVRVFSEGQESYRL